MYKNILVFYVRKCYILNTNTIKRYLTQSSINKFMPFKRLTSLILILIFLVTSVTPLPSIAQVIPSSNAIAPTLATTAPFHPVSIEGMRMNPKEPLQFDFIVDTGDTLLDVNGAQFRQETTKLIKYFLAALTVPENEVWVNLSPYEKDRVIADGLGQTEMGRDMLAEDYLLKQLTSSLIYPESGTGKNFWSRVYTRARELYGTTDIPTDMFNKVWIVPDRAAVYERGNSVYITDSHLKVMLESDYLAAEKQAAERTAQENNGYGEPPVDMNTAAARLHAPGSQELAKQIVREVVIPELEKEVNSGRNFSTLRQIYNAMILAVWFKVKLENSLLGQVYVNRNKTSGVDAEDKNFRRKIYEQYVESFKKGVYNYIREEYDPVSDQTIPRKYFSGGVVGIDRAMLAVEKGTPPQVLYERQVGRRVLVGSAMKGIAPSAASATGSDAAMKDSGTLMGRISNARQSRSEKNWTEAIRWYEGALELDARNTEALSALGDILSQQGRQAEAEKRFEAVIGNPAAGIPAIDRSNTQSLNGMAELRMKQGNYAEAQALFERARTVDQRNAHARNGLARVAVALGQKEEAVRLLNAVLTEIDANNREALEGLASFLPALGSYDEREYRQVFSGILQEATVHDIYNILYGNQPFDLWLKNEATQTATRFRIKGLAGLTAALDAILSEETSEEEYRSFVEGYLVPQNRLDAYFTLLLNTVPAQPALNRLRADLYRIARDFTEPDAYLRQLRSYLDGLEAVFEAPLRPLAERVAEAGVQWQPLAAGEQVRPEARFRPQDTERIRELLSMLDLKVGQEKLEAGDWVIFEDQASGLVMWRNLVSGFPEHNYLYDNPADTRSARMKELWKSQEGETGQIFIGYRSEGLKVPVAMIQAASAGEGIFLFMPPEKAGALLPQAHAEPKVAAAIDFIRKEMSLPQPVERIRGAAMEDIGREARAMNEALNSMVNVRGASGAVIGETDTHYYIESAKHFVVGPGQFMETKQVKISFYAGQFSPVLTADVVNQGEFFEGGAAAGFYEDILLLRIAKSSIPEQVRSKIRVPVLSPLRQDSPQVWSPYQPVAFIGLSGDVRRKNVGISYGYTSNVPLESRTDSYASGNVPVTARSETGFSGGPILTMFGEQKALVGSRTKHGWNSEIFLGYFTPAWPMVQKLIDFQALEEQKRPENLDRAMITRYPLQIDKFPISDYWTLKEQPAVSVQPIIPKELLGRMPSAVNKQDILNGRIDVIYNPEDVEARYFPAVLKNADKVLMRYSYDGAKLNNVARMVRSQDGTWQAALSDVEGHAEIYYTFIDGKGNQDKQIYKSYLFIDNQGWPITMVEGHAHTHIDLEQVDTNMIPALAAGGMERALFFDRHNKVAEAFLKAYPQLRALAWVTLSERPYKLSPNRGMPDASDLGTVISMVKANPGFMGLKFHPTIDQVPANDERVKVFLRELSKLQHPLGLQYSVLIHGAVDYGEPRQIRELAEEFPNLNFIIGHIFIDNTVEGGKDSWSRRLEAMQLARDLPNVYLETSWAPWGIILKAVEIAGSDKVIFGTDLMSGNHHAKNNIGDLIRYLKRKLDPMRFSQVMSGNAQRLFGFDMAQRTPEEVQAARQLQAGYAPGGVDFNRALMNLQVLGDGRGMDLPLPQNMPGLTAVEGFTPLIIRVTPMSSPLLPE